MDRKTVRNALRQEHAAPVRIVTLSRQSKLDAYKGYITDRLNKYPRLPATAVYEEIIRRGYTGKIRILNEYMEHIRGKKTETFMRIETLSG